MANVLEVSPSGEVLRMPGAGAMLKVGSSLPAAGESGYANCCIFLIHQGTAGYLAYINEGTSASCSFKKIVTGTSFASVTSGQLTTSELTGGDTVSANTVLGAIQNLETAVNQLLNAAAIANASP